MFLFQIPAKPNYSLVLYYAAERPVNKSSLLGKFVDGTDMFRDSRFKLIPSIIEVSNTYRQIIRLWRTWVAFLWFAFDGVMQRISFQYRQGYWMVKRAVGTKACLLGKAVTCKYLRQDNFLEVIHFHYSLPPFIAALLIVS